MDTVRWNLAVSADIDRTLRMFLVSQGGGRKGDLSRFIEEAVRCYILEQTAKQAKSTNAELPDGAVSNAVEEALAWARRS